MFIPWVAPNQWCSTTALCARGSKRKRRSLAEEKSQERDVLSFKTYSHPLEMMSSCRYLEWTLTRVDYTCPSVSEKIWKARKVCARLLGVLGKEVAWARTSGRFYIAVSQATLLFGSETWVVTPCMARTLGGVLPLGGETAHGKMPPAPDVRELELPLVVTGHAGSGSRGDGCLYW